MYVLIFFFTIFFYPSIQAFVVGSQTAVSRQENIVFPAADSDNEMRGFAAFENGFSLEDETTTCTFNSSFLVSGEIDLGGGSLFLNKDLIFENACYILSTGRIRGDGKRIEFPKSLIETRVPYLQQETAQQISDVDTSSEGVTVNSVDWSYDGSYVVSAMNLHGSDEIQVYSFNGSTLSFVDGAARVTDTNCVRWHPSLLYIACVVDDEGYDTYVYQLSGGTLSQTGQGYLTGSGFACAWHPSGNYLATGANYASGELKMWDFNTGTGAMAQKQIVNISPDRAVYALSFSPNGDYLAVGTVVSGSEATLLIYSFNGTTLTYKTGIYSGATVYGVDWSSTGDYIAVGMAATTESLRVYTYDSGENSLSEVVSARPGEGKKINEVYWSSDESFLLYAADTSISPEYGTYSFDASTETLSTLNNYSSASNINAICFSPDDNYVFRADGSAVVVSRFSGDDPSPMIFDGIVLVLNTDTIITKDWRLRGNCKVFGNGKKLLFENGAKIELNDQANVEFHDVCFSGLEQSNLCCLTDNASITLQDSVLWLSRDFTFSHGSLVFERDVVISGTVSFEYQSSQVSTIAADSTLYVGPDVAFKYAPIAANKNLLTMEDETSRLYLDGATLHVTYTGLRLSGGTLLLDNKATLSSDARNSGEACEFASDLNLKLLSGAVADIHGIFRYV